MKSHQEHYKKTIKEYFSAEEIKSLHEYSNWRALWEVVYNWLWIIAAFALVYFLPNVLTVVVAMFVIGGKQLGCAIIMHDAGHKSLFGSKKLNWFFGNFFGAYPIFLDVSRYGKYHLEHHLYAGLDKDPDFNLTKGYPASKWSMFRKILRDLIGLSGIKGLLGSLAMHAGFIEFELGGRVRRIRTEFSVGKRVLLFLRNFSGPFLANLALFGIFLTLDKPLLYLLWFFSFLTTFYFCIRIRSITEHSMVEDSANPMINTRTTQVNFIEKLLFAPLHVNFHSEHHLIMSVPCYHLPRMHKILAERGYYKRATQADGYWQVFQLAISK